MAGIWNSENKVIPGAYINIRTNEALSINTSDRGTVLILQELSVGSDNDVYVRTKDEDTFDTTATLADKKLSDLAFRNASKVLVLKLKTGHKLIDVKTSLDKVRTLKFDTLVYPYDEGKDDIKEAIKNFVIDMRDNEGSKIGAVLANYSANHEAIINVVQSLVLNDDTTLNTTEVATFIAGLSAGANITKSNTGTILEFAKDVVPRLTKTGIEEAIRGGKLVFKVDNSENVSIVYDINSLTSFTKEKGTIFSKNRVVRTLDSIANDIARVFESNYVGKLNNNADGRNILKSGLIEYFKALESLNAIEDFEAKDIEIKDGKSKDSVIIDLKIKPLDSVEKIYINVNLG